MKRHETKIEKRKDFVINKESIGNKKWQATYITLLQPNTFAAFPLWRIQRELVV